MNNNEIEPRKIYVSNIPYETTEQALKDFCSKYGRVLTVSLPRDKKTGSIRGFAFVEFETEEEAKEVQTVLDSTSFGGRTLHVNFANKRRPDRQREGKD